MENKIEKKYDHNFFTAKGIDISSTKSMWEFLAGHFTYDTMNSWNNLRSIANKVKIYDLELEGDCWTAMNFLNQENYTTINCFLQDWEYDHPGYRVGFNGRSGGYIVLYNDKNNCGILPSNIFDYDTYEDWVADLHDYGENVSDYKGTLREYTELVREFDELCNECRDYVNDLSKMDYASMQLADVIENFNCFYGDDLKKLGYSPLEVVNDKVNICEIKNFNSLLGCFKDMLNDIEACDFRREGDFVWLEAK